MFLSALLSLGLIACDQSSPREPYEWPPVIAGAPMAGAAEATLDLPIGGPLGGYSSRCGYLGSASKQDKRDSAYTVNWDESTGAQTRPGLKAVWLYNGDDNLVIVKADVIYVFDGMVEELSARLSEAVGVDLTGKVVIAASHSHASFSNFSDQVHFYLGGDRYNEEVYQRMLGQAFDVAMAAHDDLQPAAIGASWTQDWDPDDTIYRDRRGENDDLVVWEDQADYVGGKDPFVYTLRVDSASGEPIAVLFTFGVHGTVLGDDNSMISSDAPGHLELGVQEQFDSPVVVMHLQGAGGDASPGGRDQDYARLESIGEYAAPLLKAIWEDTPTSTEPLKMETASRHISESLEEIQVSRDGAVDYSYLPYEEGRAPDELIYEPDGSLSSPFDEFNALYGAAFCGSDDPLIPAGDIGSSAFPYTTCMDVELVSRVLLGIFDLQESDIPLPMPSTLKAGTTASRIGPLLTRGVDGSESAEDLLVGFFPGEVTSMYAEQWRRRVSSELGYKMPLIVGYAQDHEGYLLIPEDWMVGGYEPNINVWGPLQAEHIMEGVLDYAGLILGSDFHEPEDPLGWWAPTEYPERSLEPHTPDSTPDAGALLTSAPDYFWLPLGWTRDMQNDMGAIEGNLVLDTPETVARVQGTVQLAWEGGDPAVDFPRVALEREEAGQWVQVTSHSGRAITDAMPDILLAHTPDPLYPHEDDQVHRWWAGWQAVSHVHDRAGLPTGTYRLVVSGQRYTGGDVWPFESAPYTVEGPSFEVVPAEISIEAGDGGYWAWIQAPADGWRLVDMEGDSRGDNPLRGQVTVTWSVEGAEDIQESVEVSASEGRSWLAVSPPEGAVGMRVDDGYENTGSTSL